MGAATPALRWIALLALCAAYLQGGFTKLLDFEGAVAEATQFGLPLPALVATGTILLELGASALVLSGRARWLGALALGLFTLAATFVANRFWEMPPGLPRFMTANAFHEHLGLVGAWLLVCLMDWQERQR
ncbi:DoxX family protein [Falsiroseomonas ponticola]|uniref:DoxX family protein n=1 Tax=Falsiroseomonas ponticola TaxID=2786951 RepID=UPI001931CF0B|nr:DoxX family protein [Roseomonas ponticola]